MLLLYILLYDMSYDSVNKENVKPLNCECFKRGLVGRQVCATGLREERIFFIKNKSCFGPHSQPNSTSEFKTSR